MIDPLNPTDAELAALRPKGGDLDRMADFEEYVSALANLVEIHDEDTSDGPNPRQRELVRHGERNVRVAFAKVMQSPPSPPAPASR